MQIHFSIEWENEDLTALVFLCRFSRNECVFIAQKEINAVPDEQIKICADILRRKTGIHRQ